MDFFGFGLSVRTHPEPEFVNPLRSSGIDSQSGGTDSLESIPGAGLPKRLQIRALASVGGEVYRTPKRPLDIPLQYSITISYPYDSSSS